MDDLLKGLASEADKSFSSGMDLSDKSPFAKAGLSVLTCLDEYEIGPAVLSLLIVFAFSERSREKIWQGIQRTIRKSRDV